MKIPADEKYFLTEEYRLHQKNIYIPLYIVGYGKCNINRMFSFFYEQEYSPFAEIIVRSFNSNRDYNSYIKKFQNLGTKISYSNDCKTV